jgi:hypothetical protein
MIILINCDSRSYILESLPGELIHETYDRLWKIINHQPDDDYSYEQLVRISKLWYYKKKLNCRYSSNIEKLINLF